MYCVPIQMPGHNPHTGTMDPIGERLRAARVRNGLKAREVASMVGISESELSRYENGRKTPGGERLQWMLHVYVREQWMTVDEALGTGSAA